MRNIGIITDSVSNLPKDFQGKKTMKILPVTISFGADTFRDGIDLTPGDFYRMLENYEHPPQVSTPTSHEFLEMFESMKEDGFEGAVCILSCNICKSFNQACEARDFVRPYPVVVIDSHTSTMSQGFMVMEAVRAAEEGLAITDIVERVWNMRQRVNFYGLAGILHYMVRSGRMGKGKAYFQALLNLKQVYTINKETGAFIAAGKARSRQEGLHFIKKKIEEEMASGGKLHVSVLHSNEDEEAEKFYQELSSSFDCSEIYLQELSPAVGCLLGPGVVGASYYVEKDQNQG